MARMNKITHRKESRFTVHFLTAKMELEALKIPAALANWCFKINIMSISQAWYLDSLLRAKFG
ncbi:MAG: hypothetical protein KAS94_04910, partial [Desulfobulbaceae bacterium]|nr:hypothetical protein [Desulfobulbaceae bacterium]